MINELQMSLYSILDKAYFHLINFLTDKELYYLSLMDKTDSKYHESRGLPVLYHIVIKIIIVYLLNDSTNHYRFINHIIFRNITDPIIWAPIITPKITLQNCTFTSSYRVVA